MAKFEFALNPRTKQQAFENAEIPVYETAKAAGCDFKCAEKVTIPSVFTEIETQKYTLSEKGIKPTLVHTGIKAIMNDGEYLMLANRSSGPIKKGLILTNGVGIIDGDYANNESNDGEIMFQFINVSGHDITIEVGERIGQGIFHKYEIAENAINTGNIRTGGHGSTNN